MAEKNRLEPPVDVRIIVEGASDAETVSKVLQRMALGGEYNITVSSIIPTTNPHIARRTAEGADLVLIATDADKPGRKLARRFSEELENIVGRVERVKLPLGHDVEHVDLEIVERELRNALVRAGLKSLRDVRRLREENEELREKLEKGEKLKKELEERESELEEIREKLASVREENERLKEEREELVERIEQLESQLEKLEESVENGCLRIFDLEPVCEEVGVDPEELDPATVERLGNALGERVVVGATKIAAPSREEAVRALKAYKIALDAVGGGKEDGAKASESAEDTDVE